MALVQTTRLRPTRAEAVALRAASAVAATVSRRIERREARWAAFRDRVVAAQSRRVAAELSRERHRMQAHLLGLR